MQKKNIIGLIGLGYVGLPLLLQINKKFTVYGFDIDDHKIGLLKKKTSYISDISKQDLSSLKSERIFNLKYSLDKISECNFLILCLPTPLKKGEPDMSSIKKSLNLIFPYLKKKTNYYIGKQRLPWSNRGYSCKKN